jgi:hypothetical protein
MAYDNPSNATNPRARSVVVILEDRKSSPAALDLKRILTRYDGQIEARWATTPLGFMEILDQLKNDGRVPDYFIIDIMIGLVENLDAVEIENVYSPGGVLIGALFAYRVLRARGSRYNKVPLTLFSILSEEETFSDGGLQSLRDDARKDGRENGVKYIEKEAWQGKIKEEMDRLVSRRKR